MLVKRPSPTISSGYWTSPTVRNGTSPVDDDLKDLMALNKEEAEEAEQTENSCVSLLISAW